jgi:subtilisin family serine protease
MFDQLRKSPNALDTTTNSLPSLSTTRLSTAGVSAGLIDPLQRHYSTSFRTPSPQSDNTLVGARNLGLLSSTITIQNSVGSTDTQDYYRFTLNSTSHLNLSLTGMSNDADVQLLNSNGSIVATSTRGVRDDEAVNLAALGAGTYFVRVYQSYGNTNYILRASTESISNLITVENKIGALNGTRTFTGSVNDTDTSDIYQFSIADNTAFNLSLTGLTHDANVRIIDDANKNGVIDIDESFSLTRWGTFDESLNTFGGEGDGRSYFIQIYQGSGATNYTLNLSTTNPSNLLSVETEVGILKGSRTFGGTINSSNDAADVYHFNLAAASTFNLALTDLASDSDVRLIRDANNNGIIDPNEVIARSTRGGTSNESIGLGRLEAGNYFVQVYQYARDSGTAYTLTLSQNSIFNPTYGYGLVNAAAAVAKAIGQPTFATVQPQGIVSWDNDMVNAEQAWARGYTGQGITVAVIDSGVDITHPDLRSNIWHNSREIPANGIDDDGNGYIDDFNGWNFGTGQNNNNVMPGTTTWAQGHGTHVAGTIAASKNSFGVTGVAYNARIMPIRLSDVNEFGEFSNPGNLASAIRYAVDNGARVINLSLGWIESTELQDAFAYAAARNVITVSAAGNAQGNSAPSPNPSFPARFATEYGIAVGAVDRAQMIAPFSYRPGTNSSMQYVVAPGVRINSTLPGIRYGEMDGTSMAAPHVAGVVALMLNANPNLTTNQVRQILTSSATSLA